MHIYIDDISKLYIVKSFYNTRSHTRARGRWAGSISDFCSTLCLKKFPIFTLSITLSNLNRFLHFLHCWKAYKICYKPIRHYPPYLRPVATLPWEIKNSNFWPLVNCACVPQRFNSLLTPCFVQRFSGNSSLCCVPLQIQTFLLKHCPRRWTMLIVDKHCSDVCCDEFSVPQIDWKSK